MVFFLFFNLTAKTLGTVYNTLAKNKVVQKRCKKTNSYAKVL